MCTVSYVANDWLNRHPDWTRPFTAPNTAAPQPVPGPITFTTSEVSRTEFDKLKAELEAVKKLLAAAKIYDEETNQPDCEDPDKVAIFKALAKLVGVDLNDIFPGA